MASPNIEGTYHLIRREVPQGAAGAPTPVKGMCTFTKQYRNFSVVWGDEDGKHYFVAYVARYTLTETEYTETSEYLVMDNELEGMPFSFDLSTHTASSPVTVKDGVVGFALPMAFEKPLGVRVEFEGNEFRAISDGRFIDHWERVD